MVPVLSKNNRSPVNGPVIHFEQDTDVSQVLEVPLQ
jgi:hypothetical protein